MDDQVPEEESASGSERLQNLIVEGQALARGFRRARSCRFCSRGGRQAATWGNSSGRSHTFNFSAFAEADEGLIGRDRAGQDRPRLQIEQLPVSSTYRKCDAKDACLWMARLVD